VAEKCDTKISTVLFVGDWVVDENWVTGVPQSSSSSRKGEAVVLYREPLTTKEMRYPRLSRRVKNT